MSGNACREAAGALPLRPALPLFGGPTDTGGKMGPMSGDPVDLRVQVGMTARNATQPSYGKGTAKLGDTAALRAPNGLDIAGLTQQRYLKYHRI